MKNSQSGSADEKQSVPAGQVKLRLWPGMVLAALLLFMRYLLPLLAPGATAAGILGGTAISLLIIAWWIFFSRAKGFEKWGAVILIILSLAGTYFILDESIATANMGLMYFFFSIPPLCFAFVMWSLLTRNISLSVRRISMAATIIIASGFWFFLRTDGMTGDARHKLNWRWARTPEDMLLAREEKNSETLTGDTLSFASAPEWPGFRGKDRDGIIRGLRIGTDWSVSPPVELWRRPIGPGCSSFAIQGDLIYTLEQLGEFETVSCYSLISGQPVWKHKDQARFYDSHAGAGPRSTPAIANGRVYTLGATGILNALDARNGTLIWSRNAAGDAKVHVRTWGISGSPLVAGDVVIVSLAGRLAAFNISDGKPVWFGTDGGSGYSSPHLLTICNVPQVLLMSETGAVSVDPASGQKFWDYPWPLPDRVLQPAWLGNDELLLNEEYKNVRRIRLTRESDSWKTEDVWTSSDIKMLFNDFVIHKGYAYGFDGPSMACINLNDGKRTWRGARYRGFQVLLADQDLILVLTEKGELALVKADPDRFTELSRIQALGAKTWSHPALAGNSIVVRNAEEMAAYRLPEE